jgi:hypothetical protein
MVYNVTRINQLWGPTSKGSIFPIFFPSFVMPGQTMEKCVESGGKTKAIGISNFSVEKTEKLLSYAKVAPVVNQVEFRWWDFAGFSLYGEHLCSNA